MQVSQVPGVASSGGTSKISLQSVINKIGERPQLTREEREELSRRPFIGDSAAPIEYHSGKCRELSAEEIEALRLQLWGNLYEYEENALTSNYKKNVIKDKIAESDQIPDKLKQELLAAIRDKDVFDTKQAQKMERILHSLPSHCSCERDPKDNSHFSFLGQPPRSDMSAQVVLVVVSAATIGYMLNKMPAVRMSQKVVIMIAFLTSLLLSMYIAESSRVAI